MEVYMGVYMRIFDLIIYFDYELLLDFV